MFKKYERFPAPCRRHLDRRRIALLPLVIYSHVHRRRHRARREADQSGYYVDRYQASLLALVVTIFLLNCMDALLTLRLLEVGAKEVNPFMAALLDWNWQVFTTAKFTLTGLCLALLVLHVNFRLFRVLTVRHLLWGLLGTYTGVIVYEGILLGLA